MCFTRSTLVQMAANITGLSDIWSDSKDYLS